MSSSGKQFAADKVKEHITAHLSRFQRIQVKQMLRLPCLTDIDRQEIRAACDRNGNNFAVYTFLEVLWCRDSWVTLLVDALRQDHMRDLAEELQGVYNQHLPASQRIPPVAPPPSASANIPHAQGMAAPSDAPPPNGWGSLGIQDMGDSRTPVQENRLPAEKNEVVEKLKANITARAPHFSPPSSNHPSSNTTAVGEKNTPARPSNPNRFLNPVAPNLDAGSVGQQWDGRQPRPVTVRNGRFGNKNCPEPNVASAALPAPDSVPGNQPEENYCSLDDSLTAPVGQKELQDKDLLREVKGRLPLGDQTTAPLEELAVSENLPTCQVAEGSKVPNGKARIDSKASHVPVKDTAQLPRAGFLPGTSSAQIAHLPQKPLGTQPASRTSNTTSDLQCQLPPSDFSGSTSMDVIPPNSLAEYSAALSNNDVKPPERKPFGKLDSKAPTAGGQEKTTRTHHPAVVDYSPKNCVFLSNPGEQDMPSKPGVLASVPPEPSEDTRVYSGTSERLCLSSSFSLTNDPLLISDISSSLHPTASPVWGRKELNGTGNASGDEDHEDDSSIRMHEMKVAEEPSEASTRACEEMSLERASSRYSSDASPDSLAEGQVEGRVCAFSGTFSDSLPEKKAKGTAAWTVTNKTWVLVGCALASVALVAFGLYKKK